MAKNTQTPSQFRLQIPSFVSVKEVVVVIGVLISAMSTINSFVSRMGAVESTLKTEAEHRVRQEDRITDLERKVNMLNDDLIKHVYSSPPSSRGSR